MDLYCKEALAKLEDQGEIISRSEVRTLLQQHGLEQFADDFEESIQRG
jgi:citrate lyase synthetase